MSLSEADDNLRCSDADREQTATVLGTAYAEGRLTLDEHETRLSSAWTAKTRGELKALTEDLLATQTAMTVRALPPEQQDLPVARYADHPDQPVANLSSIMSTVSRGDGWVMPERTNALSLMGELKLDLIAATFARQEVRLNVTSIMGSIDVEVPAGVTVRDETTTILGEVRTRGLSDPIPGSPQIVLTGLVLMGEVRVRGPLDKKVSKGLRRRR